MKVHDYLADTVERIQKQGFRVFIAERGNYGFFTDADGSRVISFGIDLLRITFSGNYVTDKPSATGTGWGIGENLTDMRRAFAAYPPSWAVRGSEWRYATLEDHQNRYQSSSKYEELVR